MFWFLCIILEVLLEVIEMVGVEGAVNRIVSHWLISMFMFFFLIIVYNLYLEPIMCN